MEVMASPKTVPSLQAHNLPIAVITKPLNHIRNTRETGKTHFWALSPVSDSVVEPEELALLTNSK